MFIDATPNGELATECKKALKTAELKIHVIERQRKSLWKVLSTSDPFQNNSCEQDTCKISSLYDTKLKLLNLINHITTGLFGPLQ